MSTDALPASRALAQTQDHARAAWWAFATVAAILLPVMVLASFDFGVTWDEKHRHKYGELVWEFMRGLRTRDSFPHDGGHLYGGLFDTICAAVEPYIRLDRYVVRHGINAVFGWIGVVYAGRLARRLFEPWAGVLAMILLATSPRYFADSMNNPKDLPFAAATIAAIYYGSTVSTAAPYLSASTATAITIALAAALNIRAAALLYIGYLWVFVAALVLAERNISARRVADTVARLGAVTVAVLLLGTVFWPWAQASPFTRPVQALLDFSHSPFGGSVLYDGRLVPSSDLPWHYVPVWLLISTPPVVLLGIALSAACPTREWRMRWLALLSIASFPIVLVIVRHSTLYDGVRHLLFVYPVLVVVAAAGWTAWLSGWRRRWMRGIAAAVLALGLYNVIAFDIRFHPAQAVYFNELVGGPRGAFGRFDLDYWGNSVLEAVAWSAVTAQRSAVPITVSGVPFEVIQLDAGRFHQLSVTQERRRQHQLDIRLARGSAEAIAALAARPDALYRVRTPDGAVLCVVLPGPAFEQLAPRFLPAPPGLSLHRMLRQ